jgi:hypothetical protein
MANSSTVADCLISILPSDVIILMTYEAHFHLSVCVNKQNIHYWAEENPQQFHERPASSQRICVWCGVVNFGVICPYFFQDKDGHAVTVTSACHVELPHARTESSWNWALKHMVPARWYNYPYSESIHGGHSGNVSVACYLTAQRASMAYTFTWTLCLWLFPFGYTSKQKCTPLDHTPSMTWSS